MKNVKGDTSVMNEDFANLLRGYGKKGSMQRGLERVDIERMKGAYGRSET